MKQIITIALSCTMFLATAKSTSNQLTEVAVRRAYSYQRPNHVKLITASKEVIELDRYCEGVVSLPIGEQRIQVVTNLDTFNVNTNVQKGNKKRLLILLDEKDKVVRSLRPGVYQAKKGAGVSLGGGRTSEIIYIVDGITVRDATKPSLSSPTGVSVTSRKEKSSTKLSSPIPVVVSEKSVRTDATIDEAVPVTTSAPPQPISPTAGKLTTGEINDFTKWEMWNDISSSTLKEYQNKWQYYLNNRYTIQLTNLANNPVLNAKVTVTHDGQNYIVFTDNTGKAELWLQPQSNSILKKDIEVTITYADQTFTIPSAKRFENGINYLQLPVQCSYNDEVDICFVVDATGSMGDEIQYLKTEINDVITRASKINKDLTFRTSAVFYQDLSDTYLTINSDFSKDLKTTLNFISKQYAGGGGDFPEAVDDALDVALRDLNWNENARTKILFLVLDAPPHEDEQTKKRYAQLIQLAATKGIRIVPLSGSGIDKSTEFLMRATALMTNGTYSFLTNHSGVGNDHIAPTTDNFKVEKMNDLLIRLITQFSFIPQCNQQQLATIAKDSTQNENPFGLVNVTKQINVYPNPSQGLYNVEKPADATEILVTDITGKIIKRVIADKVNLVQVDITGHPSGIYFIRVNADDQWLTQKVVLQTL